MTRLRLVGFFGAALVVALLRIHLVTRRTPTTVRCTNWSLEWFPNGFNGAILPLAAMTKPCPDSLRAVSPDAQTCPNFGRPMSKCG